jgi:Zn-dependent alcohol dehydrogenase
LKVKAAIAFAAGKQLEVEMVDLAGPKAGEVHAGTSIRSVVLY